MHPLVESQLTELTSAITGAEHLVAHLESEIIRLEELRNDLQQEQWRLKKELAALQRLEADYEELNNQNGRLQVVNAELREGLKSLLAQTRALRAEVRE